MQKKCNVLLERPLTSNSQLLQLQVAGKKQFSLKSNFLLSKRKKIDLINYFECLRNSPLMFWVELNLFKLRMKLEWNHFCKNVNKNNFIKENRPFWRKNADFSQNAFKMYKSNKLERKVRFSLSSTNTYLKKDYPYFLTYIHGTCV